MSDELFEVAFSGQIQDTADLEQVKAKVGAMFKADANKLAHLFSGKRMVIKKNIDQATADKYKAALHNAGAICEIKSLSEVLESVASENTLAEKNAPQPMPVEQIPVAEQNTSEFKSLATPPPASTTDTVGHAPASPKTDPLGITANDISELAAGLAPVGSDMQDEIKSVAEPQLDISGLDMAPVGTELGELKKPKDPPPPNTDGLSLVE